MNAIAQALNAHAAPAAPQRSEATKIEQSRAVAEVQAMVVVARQAPRDRVKALGAVREACGIKAVAERAFWKFPRGGQTLKGESIHLARELARCWGNIDYGIKELSRDDVAGVSEMLAFAWDLETNTRAETTFIVPHLRDKRGGPERLTDVRDIYETNANMGARRVREQIFAVLPPWLIEEAVSECHRTLVDGESEPLALRIEKAIKIAADMRIARDRIEAKYGKGMTEFQADDLAQLGIALRSIKRGEISADDEFPSTAADATKAALAAGPPDKKNEPEKKADDTAKSPEEPRLSLTQQLAADILAELTAAQNPRQVEAVMKSRAADIETLYAKDPEGAHHAVVSAAKEKGWVG